MKQNKWKTVAASVVMTGIVGIFAACHSNDYTATEPGSSPAKSDTSTNTAPVTPDTAMSSSTTPEKHMASAPHKGKFSTGDMNKSSSSNMKPDRNGVYEMTDVRPSFPGGKDALDNYINNNIDFPQTAIDNNTEGTVQVEFVVDENGKVTDAHTVGKKLSDGLDDAAIKVVSNMPKWTPGKVKGKDVKTRIVLPVTYQVEQ